MKRRKFITIAGGAAAWPAVGLAQHPNTPMVGFMHAGFAEAFGKQLEGFRAGLASGGFVEDRNVTIDYRWVEGRYDKFQDIANEFVARKVAVIVAMEYAGAAQAAIRATTSIPIIFGTATDPVLTGLVASISRPTGNATGVTYFANLLAPKRLELISQIIPAPAPIGYLRYRDNPLAPVEANAVIEAGKQLGREVQVLNASTEAEIDLVLANARESGVGAVLLGSDAFFASMLGTIAAMAIRHQMPMSANYAEFPAVGGFMSYGVNKTASYRDVGQYVAKALAGVRISDLPVLQPTRFSLVLNLKTTQALGLSIPATLLATADEVIE